MPNIILPTKPNIVITNEMMVIVLAVEFSVLPVIESPMAYALLALLAFTIAIIPNIPPMHEQKKPRTVPAIAHPIQFV